MNTNVLDRDKLLERCEGDARLMNEVIAIFLDTHRRQLSAIEEAIRNEDAAALERAAHTVKGTVATFGADAATAAALDLERMARDRRFEHVEAAYADLLDAIAPLVSALSEFLQAA